MTITNEVLFKLVEPIFFAAASLVRLGVRALPVRRRRRDVLLLYLFALPVLRVL